MRFHSGHEGVVVKIDHDPACFWSLHEPPMDTMYVSEEAAIKAWNAQAPSSTGLRAEDLQGFADRIARIVGTPEPDCPCNLTDVYHIAKEKLARPFTGVLDASGNRIRVGDRVELFSIAGEAVFECGAYGIAFEDVIDWDAIAGKIKECTGCDNRPDFCFNDNFISFWELLWNFNCDDDCCAVVEKA